MLLQHRSGIPDWIEDPEFPWTKSVTNVDDVLEFVLDDPADFKPDTRYEYSNTNYLLIGKILDKNAWVWPSTIYSSGDISSAWADSHFWLFK